MFNCHRCCIRHCLQTIIGDSAFFTAASRLAFTSGLNNVPWRRSYEGTSYERSRARQKEATRSIGYPSGRDYPSGRSYGGHDSRRDGGHHSPHESPRGAQEGFGNESSREHQSWRTFENTRVSQRTIERKKWLDSRGIRPPSNTKLNVVSTESNSRHNLQDLRVAGTESKRYNFALKDPFKLADLVRQMLQRNRFEAAENLVRLASKDTKCVVSWNYLIEWQMGAGRMKAAIATYNEMKKRAQVPDSCTYTALLKGFAQHKDSGAALPRVMDIYNSMLSGRSAVKPNVIHMNCVMKACSKAGNIDALFAIAAQFTRQGLTAPNNLSFTIMLNALRLAAFSQEKSARHCDSIQRSRDVWKDVISRWRRGDIWIDEELVATMGRLLLVGNEDDIDDIFSLIEQTMNIPRQIQKRNLGTLRELANADRDSFEPAKQGRIYEPIQTSNEGQVDGEETPGRALYSNNPEGDVVPGENFVRIKAPVTKEDGIAMYAKPGQNSLSLVLQAALALKLKAPATAYWNIFTKTYLVQPDVENYHAYLRILRLARASTEMIGILSQMHTKDLEFKTFRIAMATCFRDKLNPNSFHNADIVLDYITKALAEPSPQYLEQYLDVAIESPAKAKTQNAQGEQILHALERVQPLFLNLKAAMQFTDSSPIPKNPDERTKFIEGIIRLACKIVSAFDLLMNGALVPRDMHGDLTQQRSKISAFITRYKHVKASMATDRSQSKRVPYPKRPNSTRGSDKAGSWMAAGV